METKKTVPTTMKATIERILEAHQQLVPFLQLSHYSAKIECSGFMPLTIEKHGDQIIVAHYFEQNGDLVPDPDVEFVDLGGDDWLPVAIQHSTGRYCRAADKSTAGNWLISKRAMADLRSFVRLWARNLRSQGFKHGRLVRGETS